MTTTTKHECVKTGGCPLDEVCECGHVVAEHMPDQRMPGMTLDEFRTTHRGGCLSMDCFCRLGHWR